MPEPSCPDCGMALTTGYWEEACPSCLLKLGFPRTGAEEREPLPELPPGPVARGETAGEHIQRYRLVERIGEGGFGIVWKAEQETPVRRVVALKILKLGMDTQEVVRRFEAERQALALMDHPGIAKVLDAGATEGGRPFFVMDLVRGTPITRFCDDHRLSTRKRIELVLRVCEAVQHAHQKGIIHRDLKPGNVLVIEHEGRFLPKVIDFGVAKAIEEPLTEKPFYTRLQQFLGTPGYMSPEQAGLGGLDVDTRSDIYSLGILLYELLVGMNPFDFGAAPSGAWDAILKIIREEEPIKPSTRFGGLPESEQKKLGEFRQESPAQIRRVLKGDLDWIILKCLSKERSRRYATATGLAADLERHLNGEPVQAAPPEITYRFRKFAHRNRVPLTLTCLLVLSLGLAAAFTTRELLVARKHAAAEAHLRHVAETNEWRLRQTIYAADMTLTAQALERGDDESARQILARQASDPAVQDWRGWEWNYFTARAEGFPTSALMGHTNAITAIAFLKDGGGLLSAGVDGTLREWDMETRKARRVWSAPGETFTALAVHPSGTNAIAMGSVGHALSVDLVSGKARLLPIPRNVYYSSCPTPDGAGYLYSTAGWGFHSVNGLTYACDLSLNSPQELPRSGSRAVFSPDGKLLATGTWKDHIKLWSWPERAVLGQLGPVKGIVSLQFSPDGRFLAAGAEQGQLTIWDVPNRSLRHSREIHNRTAVASVRFSPDSQQLVTAGGDQVIRIWDANTMQSLRELRGHATSLWQVQWTPEQSALISTSGRAGIRIWPLTNSRFPNLTNLNPYRPVRFSRDGKVFAAEAVDEGSITLWSTADGHQLGHLTGRWEICGFAPAGDAIILRRREDYSLSYRSVPTLQELRQFALEAPTNNPGLTMCGNLSPDGTKLAWATTKGPVLVWDLTSGRLLNSVRGHAGQVFRVAFSPDGRWMLSGGADRAALLWKTDNWSIVRTNRGTGHAAWDVSFSQDNRLTGIAWMDGTCVSHDLQTGQEVARFKGEQAVLALPGAGRTIITASNDRLHFYNRIIQRECGSIHIKGDLRFFMTPSPDGSFLAGILGDGTLQLWRTSWGSIY